MGKTLLIGIGGSHSGAGKTTVAEALLKHFSKGVKDSRLGSPRRLLGDPPEAGVRLSAEESPEATNVQGWGAIKYTKTAIYSSIIDDPEILRQEDKDTERLLNAGAENVLWVRSPSEEIKEVMPLALSRLSNLKGIIIEGNSAIEFLKPDIVIFIFGRDMQSFKKRAMKVLDMADIILFQEEPSIELPEKAKKFRVSIKSKSGLNECINYLSELLK